MIAKKVSYLRNLILQKINISILKIAMKTEKTALKAPCWPENRLSRPL
jgi:hypothetical protein